jgi:hypothetical protein
MVEFGTYGFIAVTIHDCEGHVVLPFKMFAIIKSSIDASGMCEMRLVQVWISSTRCE